MNPSSHTRQSLNPTPDIHPSTHIRNLSAGAIARALTTGTTHTAASLTLAKQQWNWITLAEITYKAKIPLLTGNFALLILPPGIIYAGAKTTTLYTGERLSSETYYSLQTIGVTVPQIIQQWLYNIVQSKATKIPAGSIYEKGVVCASLRESSQMAGSIFLAGAVADKLEIYKNQPLNPTEKIMIGLASGLAVTPISQLPHAVMILQKNSPKRISILDASKQLTPEGYVKTLGARVPSTIMATGVVFYVNGDMFKALQKEFIDRYR